MGSFQPITGFLLMIKGKIIAQYIPTIRNMTNPTVSGKGLVRNQWPPLLVPPVSGYEEPAVCHKYPGKGDT